MNQSISIQVIRFCFFTFTLANPIPAFAQETDSTSTEKKHTIIDPSRNRLFTMPTGNIMPSSEVSISTIEMFLYQFGYATDEFFQFNISSSIPLSGGFKYISIGGKVCLIKPYEIFHGLSVGAEYGYFDASQLVSYNFATSVGNEIMKAHISLLQTNYKSESVTNRFPTFIQLGCEFLIYKNINGNGTKLIAETFFSRTKNEVSPALPMIGLRFFGKNSSGEIGWPFRPYFLALYENSNYAWAIPYFSFNLFF